MASSLPVWVAVQDALLPPGAPYHSPSCFDSFDNDALFHFFHLTRPCLAFIVDAVRIRMEKCPLQRPHMPVDTMVMLTLDYFAHGMSSSPVLQEAGLGAGFVPNIVEKISGVFAGMSDQFISFPLFLNTKHGVAQRIRNVCGIPDALGVLGPAHFRITTNSIDRETLRPFLNSLGYTSVVSQIICDSHGNILSVEKCCVGSTCEQQIWDTSFKGREMEGDIHGPFWVIGGEGYSLSKHVLTPVANPTNDKEVRFNQAHAKIYDVMRTTIGTMKVRFKCLTQLGIADEKTLNKKSNIIKSCSVLHNIAKKFSVPLPPAAGQFEPLPPGKPLLTAGEIEVAVLRARQKLIDDNFSDSSAEDQDSNNSKEQNEQNGCNVVGNNG